MFSCLFSLAVVGSTLSPGVMLESHLLRANSPDLQIGWITTSHQTPLLLRLRLPTFDGERDCMDDTDNSDESSSAKLRPQGFGGTINRAVLALSRSQFKAIARAPRGVLFPLFYVFCVLLI